MVLNTSTSTSPNSALKTWPSFESFLNGWVEWVLVRPSGLRRFSVHNCQHLSRRISSRGYHAQFAKPLPHHAARAVRRHGPVMPVHRAHSLPPNGAEASAVHSSLERAQGWEWALSQKRLCRGFPILIWVRMWIPLNEVLLLEAMYVQAF